MSIQHTQKNYGIRQDALEFPMMLVLSFTYVCNALCPNCPYTNSNIRSDYKDMPHMPEEIFKKIADEAGQYSAFLRISGGGEPMIHPKAVELLTYAKKQGCKIGLITNGSLFNEESSRKLLEANIDMIEFSVDACDEETYSKFRAGLKWDKLLTNVKRMIKLREEIGSTSKIIGSAINQKGVVIEDVEKFWVEGIGLDYLIKRKFLTWGENTHIDADNSANKEKYIEAGKIPCPFIFERLNIDSRGNVMVCGYDISANTSMGMVSEQTIKEIWQGEGFKYYREKHLLGKGMDIELCSTCPDWQYRSWTHNYWKSVKNAEVNRLSKLGIHDDLQSQAE